MKGAVTHLRVLDITTLRPGPFAKLMLVDLGALGVFYVGFVYIFILWFLLERKFRARIKALEPCLNPTSGSL